MHVANKEEKMSLPFFSSSSHPCRPCQVTMPALGPALLQALWAGWVLTLQPPPPAAFTPNGTHLQHLARDPASGTLYLGATNFLFQLSPELQLEATVSTGPVLDSRDCLPPVMPDECPQAQPTNNLNQLLLVSPGALVVCGSVHQGVCEQRRLGQLGQLLLRPERPGDTQYVAANDPAVSTVGLVAQGSAGEPLLFVGRGYTSRGVGGGIPPITTRALWPVDPQVAFSYEETAKLAVGRLSEYSHHFVSAFARGASAYFLFLRRDLQAQSRAFRAYVSRVCLRDQHYYSYVELPLACQGGRYGLIQAAAVATSSEVAQGEVLFAAFSSAAPPTVGRPPSAAAGASGASALCAFPLDEVDRLANRTRDACYTREGRAEDGAEVAYIEYDVNSDCAQLPVDTLDAYPCGSDHTPSPMASRVPLEATPVLEWPGVQLTAVAVTVEDGHTIAFLGDSQGQLHRVYLGLGSDGHPYSTQSIQQGSAVSRDLIFDGAFEHLYVMTQSTIFLSVPDLPPLGLGESYSCHFEEYQSPALLTSSGVMCPSPDPSEAPVLPRGADHISVSVELRLGAVVIAKASLSFYDCVAVTELRPSAQEGGELPEADEWTGGDTPAFSTSTLLSGDGDSAEHEGPPAPLILLSSLDYQSDTPGLWELEEVNWGAGSCPCVESVQGSMLMPVHVQREIRLLGRNLRLFQDSPGDNECVMELEGREVMVEARVECEPPPDTRCHITCQPHQLSYEALQPELRVGLFLRRAGHLRVDSVDGLHVVLYDCFVGHEDCSRCQTAMPQYGCVWCKGERPRCVAREACGKAEAVVSQCPAPLIHSVEPLTGPVDGGTRVTIRGSNLGQHVQDVQDTVRVAGVPCAVDPQEYEVSSSLVCITKASREEVAGSVTVEVPGRGRGVSEHDFAYQDPKVHSIFPARGPRAGGTSLTLHGSKLLTGRLEDIRVFEELCHVNSSQLITCRTPALPGLPEDPWVRVEFILDNLVFDFATLNPTPFSYEADPTLQPLNPEDPTAPFRHKPGSVLSVEGENLDLAMSKEEVVAMIGDGPCVVKTLTRHHLYCEPPVEQPLPRHHTLREAPDALPEFTVQMGNLRFSLGHVQYDGESPVPFPMAAQVGLGVGTSLLALGVIIIVLMYRRKSKQALRDYKKVQIQLENLESSVRDRCKKEFTDLMTEMTDLTSDLLGSGIPFLDYKVYAERVFFPGHQESPLHRDLGVPESRRPTVEQGLGQLSNLLNSKLFLTKFIHTLESQRTFSARDRAYVASLLTVALHGKLEYFTDILRTLLSDLVAQYVAKNPKLMLRRTETVVEKLLTNWMSICLYTFVRDSVGEPLYMLFRGIKHQVDKGPVDSVTGKAKYTLNDNRLLREDVEYRPLTLNALLAVGPGAGEAQGVPVKVLDCDTISQAKEKMLDQLYKGVPLAQRPDPRTLDVGTPMLEDVDEGGIRAWHLVKPSEEPEPPRPRRGSLRGGERERAKAIPEIYLTRLLSMKGTLQKFVDDLFQVILSTSRPVPLAVKYFFDLLDDQAQQHGISDQDTVHIWKTNSLPLRFWINIIKNPQFVFDVQTSDNMDAVLLVIAQTFMDACTLADHKLGRDSPINKLLYARDIPRYKRMVERYYADIRQAVPASDQEMNSILAELSRNYSGDLGARVALHELYKYINKYYDQLAAVPGEAYGSLRQKQARGWRSPHNELVSAFQIITALEEDGTAQKMQLGYRLQQIAAAVENKVTDL
ncbi:Plexin-B1 [Camelus dromedarius]|uniref:Plexin-B1 n=1 Tax=Camelus dromedarius TaxID=9838 RepID=A0A5N4CZS3_CAMDR|nr:Plexin-B1 [Camelus dromedarius]